MSDDKRTVEIWLHETSKKFVVEAISTHTSGPFFCVVISADEVLRFPIRNIWSIRETVGSA
jgi:hypothetical protein